MTICFESKTIGNNHVAIEQDKFSNAYKVVKTYMGRKEDERYYPTMKQAKRRFRDVLKKCEEES